jgi:hypothetical protein
MKLAKLALSVLILAPLPTYAASDQEFSTTANCGMRSDGVFIECRTPEDDDGTEIDR